MAVAATTQASNPAAAVATALSIPVALPRTLSLPNKLLIPHLSEAASSSYSILGLGDIVCNKLVF